MTCLFTHHTVCVVAAGPAAGVTAVSSAAGVPVRTVQIKVTVARPELPALGARHIVTIPGNTELELWTNFPSEGSFVGGSVCFYCL